MTGEPGALDTARRLFLAVESGELEDLNTIFVEGAQVWHNTDDSLTDIPTTIRNLRTIRENARLFSYRDIRRTLTTEGFVQQHTLIVVTRDGRRIEDRCCCICTVRRGRIERMDAYHDSAATDAMAHKAG